ncbi:MAG TPA: Ig-like domain-containing protein [Candidatus Binatia bacterium]|jgi:hypothetical protein
MKFRFLPPSIRLAIALTAMAAIPLSAVPGAAQNPGGFIEKATSTNVRPTYTAAQIQQFLPTSRGPFSFPTPYNTEGIRLTLPSDCAGQDCVFSVGYSYWRNINNHQASNTMLIVLGLDVNHGGTGPTLFSYNKVTDQVTNLGPLFPSTSNFRNHSGEGWYFSATQPNMLYVIGYGPQLYRYDVISKTMTTVFDVSTQPGLFGTNRYAIQMHSSADDKVHSATLRDKATDRDLGCLVYKEAAGQFLFYPTLGLHYDECQIDKSGRYLLIKDKVSSATTDVDNRIIDLSTNIETRLLEANGAVGHSDNGFGYTAGALINSAVPGVVTVWKYGQSPLQGTQVYRTTTWNGGIGHIAHSNTKAGLAQNQQYACGSNANRVNDPRLNEVVCFRLDTSMDVLVVAPVMTNLNAAGGDGGGCGDYCKLPKGNIDVTGQYFIWTSNMGSNRQDAFIVKVPSQLLVAGTSPPPPPTDTTPPVISAVLAPLITSSGATITWTTDEASDSQVEYGATTAYGSVTTLNGSMVTSHSQNLSGLAANTLYHYRVKSRDAAGNLATSTDKTFTTLASAPPPPGDVTPPTVSITAPVAGAIVQGQIYVTASASDNVGVVGVQFKIDGKNLGTEDTVRPFARYWYTGNFTNGAHTITAVARDKAGNTATSQPVTVTVKGAKITGPVTWTNLVNATATANSLKESCGGCGNSGAQSLQSIPSGNGYVEFTASETTTQRAVGLSRGNTDTSRADIDFAIALWNGSPSGYVEIYENGVYKFGSVSYVPGDVFRVAVASGVVKYSKNGSVFYTSAKAPTYPLLVDASLAGPQSTIANAMISGY